MDESAAISDEPSSAESGQSAAESSDSDGTSAVSTASGSDDTPDSGSRLWLIIVIAAVLAVVTGAVVMLVRFQKRK